MSDRQMNKNDTELEQAIPTNGKLYSVSMFTCRYFVTIIFFLMGVANGSGIHQFIVIFLVGMGIDLIRRMISPEFNLNAEQRQESLLRAVAEEKVAKENQIMYRVRTIWIYWIWWAYLLGFLVVPALRTPSLFTQNGLSVALIKICGEFYPVVRIYTSPMSYPVDATQVYSTIQFLSVSWWIMIVGIILEVSGGAFTRMHYELRKYSKLKISGPNMYANAYARSQIRFPGIVALTSFMYFCPLYLTLFRSSLRARIRSTKMASYILFMCQD